MENIIYKHVVEFDQSANKIVIYRMMASGTFHVYTEIPIDEIDSVKRNLEGVGRILGEALIVDMNQLRKKFL